MPRLPLGEGGDSHFTIFLLFFFAFQLIPNTSTTTTSHFTFVTVPLFISDDGSRDRIPAGTRVKNPANVQSYVSVAQLIATLANQPFADRVINYSSVVWPKLSVLIKQMLMMFLLRYSYSNRKDFCWFFDSSRYGSFCLVVLAFSSHQLKLLQMLRNDKFAVYQARFFLCTVS